MTEAENSERLVLELDTEHLQGASNYQILLETECLLGPGLYQLGTEDDEEVQAELAIELEFKTHVLELVRELITNRKLVVNGEGEIDPSAIYDLLFLQRELGLPMHVYGASQNEDDLPL